MKNFFKNLSHIFPQKFKVLFANIHIKKSSKRPFFYPSLIAGIILLSCLAFAAYGKINDTLNSSQKSKDYSIIIDAGHGGEDGGAVGVDEICEKDINLTIALKLQSLFETAGYEVIMTREEDKAIYDEGSETLRSKKKSDLHNRLDIIKSNSDNHTIFISIHQNKFPDPKYSGSQIFYSKNNPLSSQLADCVRKSIVGLIQPENTREIKPAGTKIFLLNNAQIPAIVVECGFLSNSDEAHKLVDKEYQDKLAFCIFCGTMDYITNLG